MENYLRINPKRGIGESGLDIETNLALNVNKITLVNADISKVLTVDTLAKYFGATTQVQVYF